MHCRFGGPIGYSRQAFYQFEKNNNQACFKAELVIQQVLLHRSLQPRIGTRKLLVLMQNFVQEHQLKMGRDALFDLLREHKLLVKRRRRQVQTTFSKHWQKKYPNLIREYVPKAPNLLWVSDITYILVGDGFAYLSLVTDAYSRKIVGFCVPETLNAMGSLKALSMALKACQDMSGLIHHSDRHFTPYARSNSGPLRRPGQLNVRLFKTRFSRHDRNGGPWFLYVF